MSRPIAPPEICPVCGEAVPSRAKCCPGCGADEKSGWNEEAAIYDGLDLPEEETGQKKRKASRPLLWGTVAIAMLAILMLTLVFRR